MMPIFAAVIYVSTSLQSSIFFDYASQRLIRIVIKQTRPSFARRLRQQLLLCLNRLDWIKIVAHYPRQRYMSAGGNQIGKAEKRSSFAIQTPPLHRSIVTGVIL